MPYEMPFGRHKGKVLSAIPIRDLEYALTWDKIRPEPKAEIEKELARRRGGDGPPAIGQRPAAVSPGSGPLPGSASAITARARDIIAMGAEQLQPCAVTNEALCWLLQLIDGSAAPDSDPVPF